MKRIAVAVAAVSMVLAGATSASADEVDIEAWAHKNADVIEFFVGIDVESCEGLKGLSYSDAVKLSEARNVDLKELSSKTDPESILKYLEDSNLTLKDMKGLISAFCEGVIEKPEDVPPASSAPPADEPTDEPSGSPTASVTGDDEGAGSPSPSPSPSASKAALGGEPSESGGEMAETGASDVWLPAGAGLVLVGTGTGFLVWRRWFS